MNHLRLQVFLDREQFSSGPITGKPTATFAKVKFLYQSNRADAKDDAALEEKAKAAVGEVFAQYELKREDFRFIAPPRAETASSARTSRSRTATSARPSGSPVLNKSPGGYERLIASSMLAYRSPWEFVAERFHCSETYLRALNSSLPAVPGIGAQFRVPNVIPFEIEKALQEPLQPQVDPENPITAAIEGLSQLNVYRQGTLVAVFPLSIARPGLRGRGTWTIVGAIPCPRLATRQEPWREVSKKPGPMFGSSTPTPTPIPIKPKLVSEQLLAAGPRNPAGVIWIDLAKSDSPDPLPFGLHGSSIPDQMNTLESIGGLRLSNWDISRAVPTTAFRHAARMETVAAARQLLKEPRPYRALRSATRQRCRGFRLSDVPSPVGPPRRTLAGTPSPQKRGGPLEGFRVCCEPWAKRSPNLARIALALAEAFSWRRLARRTTREPAKTRPLLQSSSWVMMLALAVNR